MSSASQSPSSPAGYESKYSNGHESKYTNGHGQPPGQQAGYHLGGGGGTDASCPASYQANMRYHGYTDNIVAAAKSEYSGQWTSIN